MLTDDGPALDRVRDRSHDLGDADARIVQDRDGVLLSVQTTGGQLYGWPVAELVGTRARMMVHPDDREIVWKIRNLVRQSGVPQSIQIRVRAFRGRWLWVECVLSALSGADGEVGSYTEATLRDVSARYLRDEALELLVDLRSAIDIADRFDDAIRGALSHLVRWGGFDAALAWHSVEGTWQPLATASCAESCFDCLLSWRHDANREEVATVATSQDWRRIDGEGDLPAEHCVGGSAGTSALLIPIVSSDVTVAVVELRGGHDAVAGGAAQLVVDVVQQLGDTLRRRRVESELDLARRHFQLAFDEAAIGMALVAPDGRFLDANASLCQLLDRGRDELATLGFQAVTHPDDLEIDLSYVRQMLSGERSTYQMEKRYLRADGSTIWGLLSVSLVRDEAGAPVHFISQIQDITARTAAQDELEVAIDELANSERRFRSLVEPSPDMIIRIGVDGRLEDINRCAETAIGSTRNELAARHVSDIFPRRIAEELLDHVARVSATGRPDEIWRLWLEPAGRAPGWFVIRFMPEEPDASTGYIESVHVVASDVTELVENEQRLSAMALVDPLTGLSNRAAVFDRLQHALDRLERHLGGGVAVAVIDLDHFKAINDTFGHAVGDSALRAVAGSLRGVVRVEDTVGRLGGDEFIVVFEDVADREHSGELGRRLHDELAATTVAVTAEQSYAMSGSVGVAFTDVGVPINDLIARADRAMYQAKSHGRGRAWTESDRDDEQLTPSSSAILRELAVALSRNQFDLHYQPIARADDRRIVGVEALLRWNHPDLGVVPPSSFLNALFSTGQIAPVGHWVIRTAIRQLAAWQDNPATQHLQVHVNASPAELAFPGFAQILRDEFAALPVDSSRLSIEITEQVLAGSVVSTSTLAEIASTGVRLVLDDFGTGISSLSHLRTRPLHGIKIDRSFVSGAASDTADRAIAESLISLAGALQIDVTAEGVESAEQAAWLEAAGCAHLQGWHIGRPMHVADVPALVAASGHRDAARTSMTRSCVPSASQTSPARSGEK